MSTSGGDGALASGVVGDAASAPPLARAATWRVLAAAGDWCSAQLAAQLPWAAQVTYTDRVTHDSRLGGRWHLLGFTQRGRIHAHDGTHREDEMAIASSSRGFALVAADGAGSSAWSRVAAAAVCRDVVECARALWGRPDDKTPHVIADTVARSVDRASLSLREAAERTGLSARDVRTTALVAISVDDALVTLQVGDGAIVGVTRDGALRRLGVTDSGGYSGEVTAFVPDASAEEIAMRVAVHALEELESVLVVTDGIEDPFYPFDRKGLEVVRQLYEGVERPLDATLLQRPHGPVVGSAEALERLAEWMAFERRGENDDRTLVGAFRLPPRAPSSAGAPRGA